MRSLQELEDAKKKLGNVGALDFLLSRTKGSSSQFASSPLSYRPFYSKDIEVEESIEKYRKPPGNWPRDQVLPPLRGPGNDYRHLLSNGLKKAIPNVTIIVLTYNRDTYLEKTLVAIQSQNYPLESIEVIVTDDGGSSNALEVIRNFQGTLDIKYCWHKDIGFTPAIARNQAIAMASNDFIIQLDVDMYPDPDLVRGYTEYSNILHDAVLIGPRKYVDLTSMSADMFSKQPHLIREVPEIVTNNDVAGRVSGSKSVDWRLESFKKSDWLRNETIPFRFFAAGNVAFSKRSFQEVGGYEERFRSWGHEDGELGFRFYQAGKYFIPVMGAWAYHQEPEAGQNETDRKAGSQLSGQLYGNLCPFYRRLVKQKQAPFEVPWVSIYIPAFNAEKTICDAIDSALRQTFTDLEVCVCDDGSTDLTLEKLKKYFGKHKRVRVVSQENAGIGAASNRAVAISKGVFIGQLDSDDYLARDVVERCMEAFDSVPSAGVVYTSYENEHIDGRIEPGYNYPIFNRYKLMTSMIAHHFRMFRRRDWSRVSGFNERLRNAVDFDFFLRLSEITEFHHLNIRGYRRRLHGGNTSTANFQEQNKNAERAVQDSLKRMGVPLSASLKEAGKPAIQFVKQP